MVTLHALTLPVEGDRYALDIAIAREVVPAPRVRPLPAAPAAILGLFNLRGDVVPLFDTAELLGGRSILTWTHAIVIDTPIGVAGLASGDVPQAIELEEPVPSNEAPWVKATYALDQRLVPLLDVAALLAPSRIGVVVDRSPTQAG